MTNIGDFIRMYGVNKLSEVSEIILDEFKKNTPGYSDVHIVGEAGDPHEHSGEYEYTHQLVNSWVFIPQPFGRKTVAAVVNLSPYAELVEYGFINFKGEQMHGFGHRMVQSAMANGRIRDMYASIAKEALIVSLAQATYSSKAISSGRVEMYKTFFGTKKNGASVYIHKGKCIIKGAVGRPAAAKALKDAAGKIADALIGNLVS